MEYRPWLKLYADKRCFVAGCNNPVIRNCSGYKRNCGKFYCDVHSVCAITRGQCVERAGSDCSEIAEDYVAAAEKISAQPQPFTPGLIGALLILAGFSPFYAPWSGRSYFWVFFALLGIPFAVFAYMRTKKLKRVIGNNQTTRPGFGTFYREYDSLKSKAEDAKKSSKDVAMETAVDLGGEIVENLLEGIGKGSGKR